MSADGHIDHVMLVTEYARQPSISQQTPHRHNIGGAWSGMASRPGRSTAQRNCFSHCGVHHAERTRSWVLGNPGHGAGDLRLAHHVSSPRCAARGACARLGMRTQSCPWRSWPDRAAGLVRLGVAAVVAGDGRRAGRQRGVLPVGRAAGAAARQPERRHAERHRSFLSGRGSVAAGTRAGGRHRHLGHHRGRGPAATPRSGTSPPGARRPGRLTSVSRRGGPRCRVRRRPGRGPAVAGSRRPRPAGE